MGGDAGVYFRSLFASEPFEGKIAGVCRKTGNSHQGNAFNVTADVTGHGGSLLYAGPLAILPFLHAQVLVEELLEHVGLQHWRVTPQRLQQFHVSVPEKKWLVTTVNGEQVISLQNSYFQLKFTNFINKTMFHSLQIVTRSSVVKKVCKIFLKNIKEDIRLNLK